MGTRRVLVVTYPYPPMPTVGGNRWLAMSKYLGRLGHEVTIITTSAFGDSPHDARDDVHRAGDLIAAPWLRRALRRPPLPQQGERAVDDTPPPAILTKLLVPDIYVVSWVPAAARMASVLHRERRFDCVVTTSAYESTHLVPLLLGRSRPPWIADFRDGWTFHPWKPAYPTALQTDLDRRLERRVVTTAERTTVVQRPVGDDFRQRLGVDAAYVPNGWDEELAGDRDEAQLPALPEGRLALVHTGTLSGGWGRSPRPLFEAMRRLATDHPDAAQRLQLLLAGRLNREDRELIDGLGLGDSVRHVGHLSRAESMALQRRADVLVMLTAPGVVWELPGKVFEYFGARRPILALAEGNEAARVIDETSTGWTVPPGDVGAITDLLRRLALDGVAERFEPRGLDRFIYPAPAQAMADEIETAISRGAARA